MPAGDTTLPMVLAMAKELTFKTACRHSHVYPAAIEAVANGAIRPRGVATGLFEFDDLQEALDLSVSNKAEVLKPVIRIAG
jgi:L-iditol 2-dehydrogenase